jgi:large subunit ribosomal protein L24
MSLRIKKGDAVMVIAGSQKKSKGRVGRVLAVFPKKTTAIVEGVNMVKKHQKARSQTEPGGIIEKEAPIHMSKLMLVEPGAKGRAGRFATKTDDKGNKVRVLKIKGEAKEITV